MSEALRYQIIDEPRPGMLSKIALPPFLVFLIATFFQPWGFLLLALNAVALNGPHRNRELVLALLPVPIYFGASALLDQAIAAGLIGYLPALYLFVAAIGGSLVCAAFAFISQSRTFELRRYLAQAGGYAA